MKRTAVRQGRGESGYALITILFLLAVAAVMLAKSLPRDAMRAERTREETLIYRGEEYARAVKLYFREHKRYPESLDDLEETDGVRFLRRRYRDPMTGDDEWRLIKMGSDGQFEDSLVYDTQKDDSDATPAARAFAAAGVVLPAAPNAAVQQRESTAPSNPFDPSGTYAGNFRGGVTAEEPEAAPVRPDGQPARGSEGDFSQTPPDQVPLDAGQRGPQLRGSRDRASSPRQAQPYAQVPAASFGSDTVSPQASELINNLLTKPRPGGLAGIQAQNQQGGQQAFQEGIAGVASKAERSGVKVYKERTLYNEWEFVYDYRKDSQLAGAANGVNAGGGNINQGQPGLNPSGTLGGNPGVNLGGPFGGQPQMQPSRPPLPPSEDPRRSPRDRGRGTRSGGPPRSPAQYRPATPVPPGPPSEAPFPGQAAPGPQGRQR